MTDLMLSIVAVLADDAPRDTGPDFGKASPLGLVVVVLLLIGTFALVWSMNRHLKRLPRVVRPRASRSPIRPSTKDTVGASGRAAA